MRPSTARLFCEKQCVYPVERTLQTVMDFTLKLLESNYAFWCDLQLSTTSVLLTGTKDILCPPTVPSLPHFDGWRSLGSFFFCWVPGETCFLATSTSFWSPFPVSSEAYLFVLIKEYIQIIIMWLFNGRFSCESFFVCKSISNFLPSVCSGSFGHTANFEFFFLHLSCPQELLQQ